ncbi:hypothetical protein GPECTOR_38g332 [Gonium pectorale]|uniref:Uncharacterized protein n=1 Tax=Gonium pectorale TaxID=33097 RepID=A0A150GC18_GONPE|nr:hypothetical protein GPECTOR_38g332 [Gonium pectorale]|eukprot:KXZ47095.1 hypothetical protein GPECTOR_38g332 [Gonium pectorale]
MPATWSRSSAMPPSWVTRRCASDDAAAYTTSAVDVRADGAMLWMPWADELGLGVEPAKALLLNHSGGGVYAVGGEYQVARLMTDYADKAQVPLSIDMFYPEWWDEQAQLLADHNNTVLRNLSSYAGWALMPSVLSHMDDGGLLQPLDKLLAFSPELSAVWQDIPQVFREAAAVYNGNIVGIPYTAEVPLLFWRRDLLGSRGLSPPSTWNETLTMARMLNGTKVPCAVNSSATCELQGFCLGTPAGCFYDGLALTAIWASMVGSYGTRGGLFFNPARVDDALLTGGAMAEAMRLYRELMRLNPNHPVPCARFEEQTYIEKCVFGFSLTSLFKTVSYSYDPRTQGWFGVSMLPGSEVVQDRSTGKLEMCTAITCPYAVPTPSALEPNRTRLVSRVPYLGRGAFSLAINRKAPPNAALAMLRSFAYALTYRDGWPSVLDPTTRNAPVRTTHLSPAALGRWAAVGYHASDTAEFLAVMSSSMQHPCLAVGLRIRGGTGLDAAFADVAGRLIYNSADSRPEEMLRIMSRSYQHLLTEHYGGDLDRLRQAYWADIGYRPEVGLEATWGTPAAGSGRALTKNISLAVALSAAGVGLLFAGVVAAMAVRRRRVAAGLWPVEAPFYSPDTSLCITDIQSSTALWEVLEAGLMDAALSLHNNCIRGLLPQHGGYECHTEGDSFVLAFPSAASAVTFALEMQVELMHLPWPEALLQHEACAVLYHTAAALAPAATLTGIVPSTISAAAASGGGAGGAGGDFSGPASSSFSLTRGAGVPGPLGHTALQPPSPLPLALLPSLPPPASSPRYHHSASLADLLLQGSPSVVGGVSVPASDRLSGTSYAHAPPFLGPELAGPAAIRPTPVARSPFLPGRRLGQASPPLQLQRHQGTAAPSAPLPQESTPPAPAQQPPPPSLLRQLGSTRWSGAFAAAAGRAVHAAAAVAAAAAHTTPLPGMLQLQTGSSAAAAVNAAVLQPSGTDPWAGHSHAGGGGTPTGITASHPLPMRPGEDADPGGGGGGGGVRGFWRNAGVSGGGGGLLRGYEPGSPHVAGVCAAGGLDSEPNSVLGRRSRPPGISSRTGLPHGLCHVGPGPGHDGADDNDDNEHNDDGLDNGNENENDDDNQNGPDGSRVVSVGVLGAHATGSGYGSGYGTTPSGPVSDTSWRAVAAHVAAVAEVEAEARSSHDLAHHTAGRSSSGLLLASRAHSRLSHDAAPAATIAAAAAADSPAASAAKGSGSSASLPSLMLPSLPPQLVLTCVPGLPTHGSSASSAALQLTPVGGRPEGPMSLPDVPEESGPISFGDERSVLPAELYGRAGGDDADRERRAAVEVGESGSVVAAGGYDVDSGEGAHARTEEGPLLRRVTEEEDEYISMHVPRVGGSSSGGAGGAAGADGGGSGGRAEASGGADGQGRTSGGTRGGVIAALWNVRAGRARDSSPVRGAATGPLPAPAGRMSRSATGSLASAPLAQFNPLAYGLGGGGSGGCDAPSAAASPVARSASHHSAAGAAAPTGLSPAVSPVRQAVVGSRGGSASSLQRGLLAWSLAGRSLRSPPQAAAASAAAAAAATAAGADSPVSSPASAALVNRGGSLSLDGRVRPLTSYSGPCQGADGRHSGRRGQVQGVLSSPLLGPQLPTSVAQLVARLASGRRGSGSMVSPEASRSPSRLALRWPRRSRGSGAGGGGCGSSSEGGTATATNTVASNSGANSGSELPTPSREVAPGSPVGSRELAPASSAPLPTALLPHSRAHSRLGPALVQVQGAGLGLGQGPPARVVSHSSGSLSLALPPGSSRAEAGGAHRHGALAAAGASDRGLAGRGLSPAAGPASGGAAALVASVSVSSLAAAVSASHDDLTGPGGGGGGPSRETSVIKPSTQPSRSALSIGAAGPSAVAAAALATTGSPCLDSFNSSASTVQARRRQAVVGHSARPRIGDWITGVFSAAAAAATHGGSGVGVGVPGLGGGGIGRRSIGGIVSTAKRPSHNGAVVHGSTHGGILCFRGFRVRVGVCSGLVAGRDVVYRKDLSRRMAYSGVCMQLTKLVSDAAVGGMVLLSASAVERLLPLPRRDMPGLVIWHKGRFRLEEKGTARLIVRNASSVPDVALFADLPEPAGPSADSALAPAPATDSVCRIGSGGLAPQDLYQALSPQLAARQLLLERLPLRTRGQVMPGVLAAPVGHVTLAMVQVVGVPVLMAWNAVVTRRALTLLHEAALELLRAVPGGYPAQMEGGLLLAAFGAPAEAVRWLLALEEHLRSRVEWPEPLLGHELGDQLVVSVPVMPALSQRRASINGTGGGGGGVGGGGGGASNTQLPQLGLGSASSRRPDAGSWLFFGGGAGGGGGGGGGVGSVGASFVSAASSVWNRRVSISGAVGGGAGSGSGGGPRFSRTRTSISYRSAAAAAVIAAGSGGAHTTGGFTSRTPERCASSEVLTKLAEASGGGRATFAGLEGGLGGISGHSGPLRGLRLGPGGGGGTAQASGSPAAQPPRRPPPGLPPRSPSLARRSPPLSHASSTPAPQYAALPERPTPAGPWTPTAPQLPLDTDAAAATVAAGGTEALPGDELRDFTRHALQYSGWDVAMQTSAIEGPGTGSAAGEPSALAIVTSGTGDGAGAWAASAPGSQTSRPRAAAGPKPGDLFSGGSGGPGEGDRASRDTGGGGSGAGGSSFRSAAAAVAATEAEFGSRGSVVSVARVGMGRRSLSERLSPLRASRLLLDAPRPTDALFALTPNLHPDPRQPNADFIVLRGCDQPSLRPPPRSAEPLCSDPAAGGTGSGPEALSRRPLHLVGGAAPASPSRRPLALRAGGGGPAGSPRLPPSPSGPSAHPSGNTSPQSPTPSTPPPWAQVPSHHASHTQLAAQLAAGAGAGPSGAGQSPHVVMQTVLRGLRVRCAAEEGLFAQDGSVDAARLYRGQHGGRTFSKLSRLCCHALMGQVLCSLAVAKRIHRAAAAGDAAAQQLRLAALPGGSGKRAATATAAAAAAAAASGGSEAETMAAAAAAAAAASAWGAGLASEDVLTTAEGLAGVSRPNAMPGMSKSETWVCSWAHRPALGMGTMGLAPAQIPE